MYLAMCVSFRFGYVCASKTMALRRLLEAESSDTGFTNQEKGVCVCPSVRGRGCLAVCPSICLYARVNRMERERKGLCSGEMLIVLFNSRKLSEVEFRATLRRLIFEGTLVVSVFKHVCLLSVRPRRVPQQAFPAPPG